MALKDRGSAQFKWMPIAVRERGCITDYCGLLKGRNPLRWLCWLPEILCPRYKNEKGGFMRRQIRLTASDEISIAAANNVCDKFGYTDFS
jgi:hypothetical protein